MRTERYFQFYRKQIRSVYKRTNVKNIYILFFFKLMEEEINYSFAALGLGCSCGSSLVVLSGGHSLALHGLLVVLASFVVEHRL